MHIEPKAPTAKGSPDWFAGDVWVEPIVWPHDDQQWMVASRVRFAPGAPTAWHRHEQGQTLHIVAGVALIENGDDPGATTTWLEQLRDDEYRRP